jgi:hypothetical protein
MDDFDRLLFVTRNTQVPDNIAKLQILTASVTVLNSNFPENIKLLDVCKKALYYLTTALCERFRTGEIGEIKTDERIKSMFNPSYVGQNFENAKNCWIEFLTTLDQQVFPSPPFFLTEG